MTRLLLALLICLLTLPQAAAADIVSCRLDSSTVYPGTVHDYWVSFPKGYDSRRGARLYVGLDGLLCDAPAVTDSLSAVGDIPQLIGIYIQPGVIADSTGSIIRYNRSNEFDAIDGRFARFLTDELLPAAMKTRSSSGDSIRLIDGGRGAMIFGLSSGGIAAFAAAWHRPDMFSRVFSGCGTFVPMRGGHELQALVRKSEPRGLRVFLQDGYSDTWNPLFGSWFEANFMLNSALEFSGADISHDWAEGGHSIRRANEIFADVMKRMWADDVPAEPTGNATLAALLAGSDEWTEAAPVPYTAADPYTVGAVYPDSTLAATARPGSNFLHQHLIDSAGHPYADQRFYWLHDYTNGALRLGGMAFDGDGNLWVLTEAGLQVCDQNGRVRAIVRLPRHLEQALIRTDSNILENSAITITDGRIDIHLPEAHYTRRLSVKAPCGTPQSQGQA